MPSSSHNNRTTTIIQETRSTRLLGTVCKNKNKKFVMYESSGIVSREIPCTFSETLATWMNEVYFCLSEEVELRPVQSENDLTCFVLWWVRAFTTSFAGFESRSEFFTAIVCLITLWFVIHNFSSLDLLAVSKQDSDVEISPVLTGTRATFGMHPVFIAEMLSFSFSVIVILLNLRKIP